MTTPYQGSPSTNPPQRYSPIASVSASTPLEVQTVTPHGWATGDQIVIPANLTASKATNLLGCTWTIFVDSPSSFVLVNSVAGSGYTHSSGPYVYAENTSFPSTLTCSANDTILTYNTPVQDLANRTASLRSMVPAMGVVATVTKSLGTYTLVQTTDWAWRVVPTGPLLGIAQKWGWQAGDELVLSVSGSFSTNNAGYSVFALGYSDSANGSSVSPVRLTGQYGYQNTGYINFGGTLISSIVNAEYGSGASINANSLGNLPVTGLTGVGPACVGCTLTIRGAATAANNGTFLITAYNSATSVSIAYTSPMGPDANNGALIWGLGAVPVDAYVLAASGSSTQMQVVEAAVRATLLRPTFDFLQRYAL